jgi:hypothetical protein
MNQLPDPSQYKLGDTIYVPTDGGTLELKCVKDAASGDKLRAFINLED